MNKLAFSVYEATWVFKSENNEYLECLVVGAHINVGTRALKYAFYTKVDYSHIQDDHNHFISYINSSKKHTCNSRPRVEVSKIKNVALRLKHLLAP